MLSAKEKRFVRYWDEQRDGGKTKYLLTYTIGGGMLIFFMPVSLIYILGMLQFFKMGSFPVWVLAPVALLLAFAGSWYSWKKNEKKWNELKAD